MCRKKWPEVLASILQAGGHTVEFIDSIWDGSEETVLIDNIPLSEFKDSHIKNAFQLYKDNIILITRIFDNKVKAFIKHILLGEDKVEYYAYRIEFQLRGMPHVHGVIWLKKSTVNHFMKEDGTLDQDNIKNLIEDWISCSITTSNTNLNKLVQEVNMHRHTKSCKKNTGNCRFHFPRMPSDKTIIATPLPSNMDDDEKKTVLEKAKKTLKVVKDALSTLTEAKEELSLQDFLQSLDISEENYYKALEISEHGVSIVLKRTLKERNINNYNKIFMLAWKGNLDIQICLDNYAVITYMTDYLSKPDDGLTQILKEALKETNNCNDIERLHYLKRTYFTHRQVSASEAVYRLISGLNLKGSNIKTKFVATGYPENRSTFLKKINEAPNDDVNEEIGSEQEDNVEELNVQEEDDILEIAGREGKFKKAKTIHEYYAERPNDSDSEDIDKMCLAQFATVYEKTNYVPKKITMLGNVSKEESFVESLNSNKFLPKLIKLSSGAYMKARSRPSVLRMHSSKNKPGFEAHYSEMLLFMPWRDELNDLKANDDLHIAELFNAQKDVLYQNKRKILPHSKNVTEMKEILDSDLNFRPSHIYETLDTEFEQDNKDDEEICEPLDTTELPTEQNEMKNMKPDSSSKYKPILVEADELMRESARGLSCEQRIVFDKIVQFCKWIVMSPECNDIVAPKIIAHGEFNCFSHLNVNYYYFFNYLSGGAGVGKSRLILDVAKWIVKILDKPGDDPNHPKVLLLGPTGMSASIIGM